MREKPVLKSDNVDDPVKYYTGIDVALGVAFGTVYLGNCCGSLTENIAALASKCSLCAETG